ncbi:AAA domain-containing protein [Lentzea sp. NBC_00516]|uniref:AAA domain-containing protein n=1 Tax=Lentzea sp. NBC_00516 TaxID=2903582 RepID=UPI002E81A7E5|nr:AAA domain-containing protein [Lentzea sp. NBC_00516]WUD29121.1 AAA domain-containing protein [Lentzea sp. NBC_00516]
MDSKTWGLDLTATPSAALGQLLDKKKTRLTALVPQPEAHAVACTRARNLRRRMLTFQEEQGVDVGRLAQGLFCLQPTKTKGTAPVKALRSPLVLQQIVITPRTAAETDYTLELLGEPEINPVLLYALNRQHGIDIDVERVVDEINDLVNGVEDPSIRATAVFEKLSALVGEHGRIAELEDRTFAGTFSFDKMPMVDELKNASELLASHDVIAAAAGWEPAKDALRQAAAAEALAEPDAVVPRDEFLVLDADSSQQRAINSVLSGQHVVIQGPPGTGKSQTIANIIAGAAAVGKRVLFVAEKRAAIEAVTGRLEGMDLGHLVFDLHQQRLDKQRVAQQVAESLDRASKEPPAADNGLHDRLRDRRDHLIRHRLAMHQSLEPWEQHTFGLYQRLLELPSGSGNPVRFHGTELRDLHGDVVRGVEDALMEFVNNGGLVFHRGESAWSHSEIRSEDEVRRLVVELDDLHARTWPQAQEQMRRLVGKVGFQRPVDLPGWQSVLGLLREVERTLTLFHPEVFGANLDDYRYATGDRRFRAQHSRPLGWLQRWRLRKEAAFVRRAGRCDRKTLHAELCAAAVQRDSWGALAIAGGQPQEVVGLAEIVEQIANARDQLAAVAMGAQLPEADTWTEEKVTAAVKQLHVEREQLFGVPRLNELRDRLIALGLARLLGELADRDADADQAREAFRFSWYSSLLDEHRIRIQHLGRFSGRQHAQVVGEFRELDAQHFMLNAQRVRRNVAEGLRAARDAHPEQNDVVRAEAKRKRGNMSMRRLVAKAPDVLLAARPCWAMSPIVVSRLLPAERLFDIVVFDEASQVEPHDAMTSIMRGSQLVVAGDEKQLPPSGFFRSAMSGTEAEDDEEDADVAQLGDYESILACLSTFVPNSWMLEWHYRSLDERLIAFSNKAFYGGKLVTFPGCQSVSPMSLRQVGGQVGPGRNGTNAEEIAAVVEMVLDHVRAHPEDTLGVITMGGKHADHIDAALRKASSEHEELAEFTARMQGTGRRLFVKSIESVQGDERDVIIFSLGAAKGVHGKLSLNSFGALNHQGGERRLNVAVTRSRKRMQVVASFSPHDIAPGGTYAGSGLLRQFLELAENGGDINLVGAQGKAELNGFERSVYDALTGAGVPVVPQWGVTGYRIDFALGHRDQPGRMVLAVEADGDTYHRLASARDRDRLRQEHLERLGWRFHRLWASDWFRDSGTQLDSIVKSWEKAMIDADRAVVVSSPPASRMPPVAVAPSRGPRPAFLPPPKRPQIVHYTQTELVELCCWLLTDRLQVDRDTRVAQAVEELGFERKSRKMEQLLGEALTRAQQLIDGQGA